MQQGKVNTDEYNIEGLRGDKKRVQKWVKRAEKGDVNHREAYHIARHLVAVNGRPSLEYLVDQTRKKGGHDIQISELRDLITCILYDQPSNVFGFKMRNKSYMRFVLIVHIEGVADGRTFQHKMRLGEEVYRLRISQAREHMSYLPYKLLTYEEDASLSSRKKFPDNFKPIDTDPRSIYERLSAYRLSIGQQRLWNYPQIFSSPSVPPNSSSPSLSPPISAGKRPVSLLEDGGEGKRARVEESDLPATSLSSPSSPASSPSSSCPDSLAWQGLPSQAEADALFLSSPALQPISVYFYDDFPINQQRVDRHDFLRTVSRRSTHYASLFPPTTSATLRSAITPLSIAAIDCEMVDTTLGREVVRVTLLARTDDEGGAEESLFDLLSTAKLGEVDASRPLALPVPTERIPPRETYRGYDVVMDCLVQPAGQVVDYCTAFSGIDAHHLHGVTTTLSQVQIALCRWITTETLLVGHSLDSDLKALHLSHAACIDTALLFPHARGFPLRRKLRHLAEDCLHMSIQGTSATHAPGHDSREDAYAALALAITKAERGDGFGPKFSCRRSMLRQYDERGVSVWLASSHGRDVGRTGTVSPRKEDEDEEDKEGETARRPQTADSGKLVNNVPRCTGRGFPFGLEDIVDGDAHMVRMSVETLAVDVTALLTRSEAGQGDGCLQDWSCMRDLNQHALRVDPPRLVCVSVVCDKEGADDVAGEKDDRVRDEVIQLVRSLQAAQPRGQERHGLVVITSQNSMKKAQALVQRKRASMLPMSSVVWASDKEAQLRAEVSSVNNGFVSFVVV